jgi:hypothetical protein
MASLIRYGGLQENKVSGTHLIGPAPTELLLTAPSVQVAVAAAAVALDCGVAGEANEPGATLGTLIASDDV